MIFLNSMALTFAITSIATRWAFAGTGSFSGASLLEECVLGVGVFLFGLCFSLMEYKSITLLAFRLDCERQARYGKNAAYDFFPRTLESVPLLLRWLDKYASRIESHDRRSTKQSSPEVKSGSAP